MRALTENDRFRFSEEVHAIHLTSPFGGTSLGYKAPASAAKALYKTELLGEEVTISAEEQLVVLRAYQSVSGWYVCATWQNRIISFYQAGMSGTTESIAVLEAHAAVAP